MLRFWQILNGCDLQKRASDPSPRGDIQGKISNKNLHKNMIQNASKQGKFDSFAATFCSCLRLVCGGWGCKIPVISMKIVDCVSAGSKKLGVKFPGPFFLPGILLKKNPLSLSLSLSLYIYIYMATDPKSSYLHFARTHLPPAFGLKKAKIRAHNLCARNGVFFVFFASGRLVHDHLPPVFGPFGLRFVPERLLPFKYRYFVTWVS